jgi:hypothetical protein
MRIFFDPGSGIIIPSATSDATWFSFPILLHGLSFPVLAHDWKLPVLHHGLSFPILTSSFPARYLHMA